MGESEKGRKTRRALRKGWMYLEQIEGRFVDRFHVVHLLVQRVLRPIRTDGAPVR